MSFKPDDVNAQDEAIRAMEDCIKDIRNWLIEGRLLLNDDQIEFLVIGARQLLRSTLGIWEGYLTIQLVWILI